MNKVTDLVEFKRQKAAEEDPHLTGSAHCLACKHEWEAVAPVGTVWLECPNCTSLKGTLRTPAYPEDDVPILMCGCGCELFVILKDCLQCTQCGNAFDPMEIFFEE